MPDDTNIAVPKEDPSKKPFSLYVCVYIYISYRLDFCALNSLFVSFVTQALV
jgi:hypothetical protein